MVGVHQERFAGAEDADRCCRHLPAADGRAQATKSNLGGRTRKDHD